MTPAEESDALALLRAACEYAGHDCSWDPRASRSQWTACMDLDDYCTIHHAYDMAILRPPYCDTLLGEILRRLRKDGWQPGIDYVRTRALWRCEVGRDGVCADGTDPEHMVLAVARAMREVWIISTETKT